MTQIATPALTASGRPPETEEPTNRTVIHPLARRITPVLARLGVRPNAVSLAGMACGIGAGLAYARCGDRRFAVAGFGLMVLWHLCDGIDGQLARLTATFSAFGRVLDGVCDYVTFIAVYAALALAGGGDVGAWPWVLAAVAGASHAVQAAAYEAQRQDYDLFGRGLGTLIDPDRAAAAPGRRATLFERLHRAYVAVQLFAVRGGTGARRRLAAALARQPADAPAIRDRYRAAFAPPVRRWSVLSANAHTVAIAVFALAGAPLFYFGFEIVGLNAVMLLLLARQRRRLDRFVGALAPIIRPTGGDAAGARPARSPRPAAAAP